MTYIVRTYDFYTAISKALDMTKSGLFIQSVMPIGPNLNEVRTDRGIFICETITANGYTYMKVYELRE